MAGSVCAVPGHPGDWVEEQWHHSASRNPRHAFLLLEDESSHSVAWLIFTELIFLRYKSIFYPYHIPTLHYCSYLQGA